MRNTLHIGTWRALQAICDDLSQMDGVVWAGITEAEGEPRWLAFAGASPHVPVVPDPDQQFEQLQGELPPATAVVVLAPPRPGRAYLCGLVLPEGLTLVVVPDPDDSAAEAGAQRATGAGLHRIRNVLPPVQAPGGGMPPAPSKPTPPTPASAWDWIPVPGSWPRRG
jgi:hypothetical protein